MRLLIDGDDWIEGMPEGDVGPIKIATIATIGQIVGPDAVPQVRRYYRKLAHLPTRPGYYLAADPAYGSTVVVELLGSPAGQWVDAGDRNYLADDDVRALGPLRRLVPIADVVDYFRREAGPDPSDSDWRILAAATIAAEWEIEA